MVHSDSRRKARHRPGLWAAASAAVSDGWAATVRLMAIIAIRGVILIVALQLATGNHKIRSALAGLLGLLP